MLIIYYVTLLAKELQASKWYMSARMEGFKLLKIVLRGII